MKIGINCGHNKSGAGSGAVGFINESIETRNVGYELMTLLRNGGHTVVDCTIDKAVSQNAYLSQAVNLANRQDLDYFISIHFNAGKGKGVEVYTYNGKQFTDALEVCQNIASLGFKNRGVKNGTGLYVVKKTKAKAMLIEVCFVDSEDADLYKKIGYKEFAKAIYKAIVDTNVPTSNNSSSTQSKPTQTVPAQATDNWVERLNEEIKRQGFSKYPTLKIGAQGNITKLVQERLNSVGFNLKCDGKFGEKTRQAIIVFQRNRGLKQDGIVGVNTWAWILKGTKM